MMNEEKNEANNEAGKTLKYTYDSNIVSDLHKEAFGFRPSQDFWVEWNEAQPDERQYIWDHLLTASEYARDIEEQKQKNAIELFEKRVENLLHAGTAGAQDRAGAIRLLMYAAYAENDTEYFEFTQGLPFRYVARTLEALENNGE